MGRRMRSIRCCKVCPPLLLDAERALTSGLYPADILLFALDNPAPATLVLISGDRDFAYTAAVLRRRHYNVILICRSQPGPHRTLLSQVASHVDWATEILGFNEPEYDVRRRPPMQTPASPSSGSLRHVQSPSMSARNLERQDVTPSSPGPDQASPRRGA